MELFEAILTRRTIKDFTPDRVPADALERALHAGLWAQNHHLTEPWRFTVLGPETHGAAAAAFAELQLEVLGASDDEALRARVRAAAEQKILSRPLLVAVTCRLSGDEQQRREDYAAVCCAIQNIQLAAWAEGLGMQWSTNKLTQHPKGYALLGISPSQEEIVGFLYFGYPAAIPPARPRKALSEFLRHLP